MGPNWVLKLTEYIKDFYFLFLIFILVSERLPMVDILALASMTNAANRDR